MNEAIIGCGEPGLDWAAQRGPDIVCIDQRPISTRENFHQADVLRLTEVLRPGSVKTIYADFILNPVWPTSAPPVSEVQKNPQVLATEVFPQTVRDWFAKCRGFFFVEDGDLARVRWLVRQAALQQMWNVLAPGGELVIVDHEHVVSWVADDTARKLGAEARTIEIFFPTIDYSDRQRSGSIKKVEQSRGVVSKIVVKKVGLKGIDPREANPWFSYD